MSPVTLSAQPRSTSELLRTLLRVAASKPTSWLSLHGHIVFHLAFTSGPYSGVWAVSLSTAKLISRSPTARLSVLAFVV